MHAFSLEVVSCQHVNPREGYDYLLLFVRSILDGCERMASVVAADVEVLHSRAKATAVALPLPKSLLIDVGARAKVGKQLKDMLAQLLLEGESEFVLTFLGEKSLEAAVGPDSLAFVANGKGKTDGKLDHLLDSFGARIRSRQLLALQQAAIALERKVGGVWVAVVVGAFMCAWFKWQRTCWLLLGTASGFGASSLVYHQHRIYPCSQALEGGPFAGSITACSTADDVKAVQKVVEKHIKEELAVAVREGNRGTDNSKEPLAAAAQEVAKLIIQLDKHNAAMEHDVAIALCEPHLETDDCDFEILWRHARHSYAASENQRRVSGKLEDPKRLLLLSAALDSAKRLVDNFAGKANSHKWYAICIMEMAQHDNTKAKILAGIEFQEHTQKAIDSDPEDSTLYYMLGRFNYEVAKLSWAERMAAKAIYGREPPKATYEDTLKCFMHARTLRANQGLPILLDNELEIARSYRALGDKSNAREVLQFIISSFKVDAREEEVEAEAHKLLASI